MASRIVRFGPQALPTLEPTEDLSGLALRQAFTPLQTGSVYDHAGADQSRKDQALISRSGMLVEQAGGDTLLAQLRQIQAYYGYRNYLIREMDDGTFERIWARFVALNVPRTADNLVTLEVSTDFVPLASTWLGRNFHQLELDDGHLLDSGLFLDGTAGILISTNPTTFTLTNNGNAISRYVIIRVVPAGSSMTSLTIKCGQAEWTFSGTVVAGQTLEINTGACSVLNNGVDAYASFAFTGNHTMDDWFRLNPGANSVTITRTGASGGATVYVEYYDAWE
ncbi:MAG TPA: hypothetical protein VGE07_23635 [Herpetosiphonaceae bacterium]